MEHFARRSPVPLVMRVIVLETIIFSFEILTRIAVYALTLNQFIPYWEVSSIFIVILYQLLNVYILISLVFRWVSEFYVIRSEEIVIINGIFSKKKITYDTKTLQALTIKQNAFERLFHYGTIRLYNPVQKNDIYLSDISDPEHIVEILEKRERSEISVINRGVIK